MRFKIYIPHEDRIEGIFPYIWINHNEIYECDYNYSYNGDVIITNRNVSINNR